MALSELVQVQQNFLGRIETALLAALIRILLALFGARVIKILALARRNAQIGLLQVAEHFLVQRFLKFGGRLHHRRGVGILRFEIFHYVGIFSVAQPEVIILERCAVHLRRVRNLLGHRRLHTRILRQGRRRQECGSQHRAQQNPAFDSHITLRHYFVVFGHSKCIAQAPIAVASAAKVQRAQNARSRSTRLPCARTKKARGNSMVAVPSHSIGCLRAGLFCLEFSTGQMMARRRARD